MALAVLISHPLTAAGESEAILLEELRKRDAIIADLLERVEELERRVRDTVVWVGEDVAGPVKRSEIDELQTQLERLGDEAKAEEEQAATEAKPRGPGAVEVDELAAERALERTLTLQGALLLPQGVAEVAPFFSYARRENEVPTLVSDSGGVAARTSRITRNEYSFGLRGQLGLPYQSQLELEVPFRVVDRKLVNPVGFTGTDATSDTGYSIGDIRIGFAKTLWRERGWQPDLIGRLTWDSDTGDLTDNNVPLGIGFNELTASLTALKRQDPLAFTATVNYTTSFEKDGVEPGDQFGFSLGASLAASPSTSLSFALAQVFEQETEVNGRRVEGSSDNSSLLLIGASSVLARQTLLAVTAGIGLTNAAPDYIFNLSLPVRF